MKVSRFLALTLVIVVMGMGAGYAYWSDTLTINNTVSTGELSVRFNEDESFTRGRDNKSFPAYVYSDANDQDGEFASDVIDDGKTFAAKIGNLYPGSWGRVQARVDNDGTIPAVFESLDVAFYGADGETDTNLTVEEQELVDTLKFTAGYEIFNEDGTPADGSNKWTWTNGEDLDDSTSGLETKLRALLQNVRLEPGQYLKFDIPDESRQEAYESIGLPTDLDDNCIFFKFPGVADEDGSLQKQKIAIKITINWKQHNEN